MEFLLSFLIKISPWTNMFNSWFNPTFIIWETFQELDIFFLSKLQQLLPKAWGAWHYQRVKQVHQTISKDIVREAEWLQIKTTHFFELVSPGPDFNMNDALEWPRESHLHQTSKDHVWAEAVLWGRMVQIPPGHCWALSAATKVFLQVSTSVSEEMCLQAFWIFKGGLLIKSRNI